MLLQTVFNIIDLHNHVIGVEKELSFGSSFSFHKIKDYRKNNGTKKHQLFSCVKIKKASHISLCEEG